MNVEISLGGASRLARRSVRQLVLKRHYNTVLSFETADGPSDALLPEQKSEAGVVSPVEHTVQSGPLNAVLPDVIFAQRIKVKLSQALTANTTLTLIGYYQGIRPA